MEKFGWTNSCKLAPQKIYYNKASVVPVRIRTGIVFTSSGCFPRQIEVRVMYGGRIRRHFAWNPSIFRSSALFSHMACKEYHKFDPTHIWKIWCFAGCAVWTWHPLQWIKALVGEWSRYHLPQIMYDTSWRQALVFLLETMLAHHPADPPPMSLCSCMPGTFVETV